MPRLSVGLLAGMLMVGPMAAHAGDGKSRYAPWQSWEVNTKWVLDVKEYSREWQGVGDSRAGTAGVAATEVKYRYKLAVVVTGRQLVKKSWCCQLDFILLPNERPAGHKEHIGVLIDSSFGWPRMVLDGGKAAGVGSRLPVSFPLNSPEGFPIEFFPLTKLPAVSIGGGREISVSTRETEGRLVAEAKTTGQGVPERLVRQVWKRGDTWWTEFERYIGGHKDLYARRVDDRVSAPVRRPGANAKGGHGANGLEQDGRLEVAVSGAWKNAALADILGTLSENTGVALGLAPDLEKQGPMLGSLTVHEMPLRGVMIDIARNNTVGGRWVRADKGYRLVAEKAVLSPEKAVLSPEKAVLSPEKAVLSDVAPTSGSSWSVRVILLACGSVALLVLAALTRRRWWPGPARTPGRRVDS